MAQSYRIRDKAHDLVSYSINEIAEMLLDLEDEKQDLASQLEEVTRERDALAEQSA